MVSSTSMGPNPGQNTNDQKAEPCLGEPSMLGDVQLAGRRTMG